jgi:CPA1 family monovalent cation:H+ antiporter
MDYISLVILLLAVVTALAQVTDRIRVPYVVMLVLAGIMIGLIPGLPIVTLDPDIVFLVFLPPVLYAAAWSTSWPDFKQSIRPISLLAVGCVLFTTVLVACAAHYLIPGFGWPEAFVLGAIVSPPDAVAATAATKGLKLPKRIITILEGESLVNDATGLIAYRYAIAATASGSFIFWLAGINFFYVAGLGIGLGLAIGYLFLWIHKITPSNATTDTTFTLLTPYAAYLVAEEFHASGVLAVVAAGLFLSPRSSEVFSNRTRLQANAVWDTMIFILNGIIFILIGLQLPMILKNIQSHSSFGTLIFYGLLISAVTILARILWVFPGAFIPRLLSKRIRASEPETNASGVSIVAWAGMRGIVSLAAALALPIMVSDKVAFPNRDLIIFLTFSVIFVTLVLQGMTLRRLIQWLGVKVGDQQVREEEGTRYHITSAVIEHIEENYSLGLSEAVLNQIKTKYEIRIQRMRKDQTENRMTREEIDEFQRIQKELLAREREFILRQRREGKASDEVVRKLEYELDLEEARLELDGD